MTTPAPRSLLIALGSTNPSKRLAVETSILHLFPDRTPEVRTFSVPSGVSDQPLSDDETTAGAINRAKAALEKWPEAEYGIGIEGGAHLIPTINRYFETGWIAIVQRSTGKVGLGSSGRFELSPKIASRLVGGEELATVIDDLSGQTDVRSNAGAMGILTNGHVNRDVAYTHGVYFAFAPFVSSKIYWE
ncbi:hypothetical protein HDV00_007983 [Rhizophlyctis rosea]|nr:hypothetical protein HDV00_007983 [Rhizophlyctis rosea]